MMSNHDNSGLRGVSNSPLTSTSDLNNGLKPDMEVKIDWFQITFDFIKVTKETDHFWTIDRNSKLFVQMLKILKRKESTYDLQPMEKAFFGYKHGYYIDEHITLNYGRHVNANDQYTATLVLSGQGCRTFEIMGGNWIDLMTFFQANGVEFLNVGRIDIAIDDFLGKYITPYQIYPYLRKGHCVTQFRKVVLMDSFDLAGGITTDGYTITLGPRGANQLQIYDKRLERNAKDQYDLDEDVWYRYEMRFVKEKARQVMDMYTASVINNDSKTFMAYAKGLLLGCLELKVFDPNDENKSRWDILPEWKDFTDSMEKIQLNNARKIDTTIEKKLLWYESDMATTTLELFVAYGEDFGFKLYEIISDSKFERKHLNRLNNYLRSQGKKEMTMDDIKKLQKQLSEIKNPDREGN